MANNVKFKAPALPIPPAQYNQSLYQRTFSILRLYFNQLDEHLRQDLGDTTINGDLTVTGGVTATTLTGTLQTAAQTNITSVGALNGGSITSGFGNINVGGSSISNTGTFTLGATSQYAPDGVINGGLTVNLGTSKTVNIINTNAGANDSPTLKLTRNSSSPADNDILGAVEFHGENSAGTDVVYGAMDCVIVDEGTGVSGNYVKGQIRFSTAKGSNTGFSPLEEPSLTIDSTGIYIGNANATGSTTPLISHYHLYNLQGFKSFSSSKTYNTLVTFDAPTANRSIKIPDVGGTVVVAGMAGGDINGGGGAGSPKTAWSLAEFEANPNVLYTHYNASNSNDLVVAVPFAGVDIGSAKYGNRYIFNNTSPAGSEIVIDLDGFTFSGTQYYVTIKYDGGTNATITSASSNLVVAAGGTIELIPVTGGIFLVTGIGYS